MAYPKVVKPGDVVNGDFAPGMFRIKGGQTVYDQVWMADGGRAVYLVKVISVEDGLLVTRRWIPWDTKLEQMFEGESDLW